MATRREKKTGAATGLLAGARAHPRAERAAVEWPWGGALFRCAHATHRRRRGPFYPRAGHGEGWRRRQNGRAPDRQHQPVPDLC
jgi:hypothetical protein